LGTRKRWEKKEKNILKTWIKGAFGIVDVFPSAKGGKTYDTYLRGGEKKSCPAQKKDRVRSGRNSGKGAITITGRKRV